MACKIEHIEEVAPISHADFLFRRAIYTLVRVADGRRFRVKLSKKASWRLGQIVDVEESVLEAGET